MEELFKPKNKEDILMNIAKKKSAKNRAFLIALYTNHEDLFDKFFSAYLEFPELDIYPLLLYTQKSGEKRAHVKSVEQARAIVKMFNILKFDVTRFTISTGEIRRDNMWYMDPSVNISISLQQLPLLRHYAEITEKHQIKRKKPKKRINPKKKEELASIFSR